MVADVAFAYDERPAGMDEPIWNVTVKKPSSEYEVTYDALYSQKIIAGSPPDVAMSAITQQHIDNADTINASCLNGTFTNITAGSDTLRLGDIEHVKMDL